MTSLLPEMMQKELPCFTTQQAPIDNKNYIKLLLYYYLQAYEHQKIKMRPAAEHSLKTKFR